MTILMANYLGCEMGELLKAQPFSEWNVTRSVEHEPRMEIWYEFVEHGIEVTCDGFDRIQTVFLHRGEGESLAGIPFSMSRREALERFGRPAKSGGAVRIPSLGVRGPWDRFLLAQGVLHVQYCIDRDEIDMITLMRPDAVP